MSVDFQVVFPQELIKLTSVSLIQGSSPPVLNVIGENFLSVDEVLINEYASSNVIIVSKTRLLAEVPEAIRTGFQVARVSVISRRLTLSPKSLIRFKLGRSTSKVRGVLRLVQLFLKVLFTTPGTDIFSPRIGAAALRNVGKSFSKSDGGTIISDFIISVDTASRQLVAIQGRDPGVPRDERLLSAKVTSSSFSASESALVVSVELTSQAGQAAQTNLVL